MTPDKGRGKGIVVDPNSVQITYTRCLVKADDGPGSRHPYYARDQTPCTERVFLLPDSTDEIDPNGMTYSEFRKCVKAYLVYQLNFVSSYRDPTANDTGGNWMLYWLEDSVSLQASSMWCQLSFERSLRSQYSLLNREF